MLKKLKEDLCIFSKSDFYEFEAFKNLIYIFFPWFLFGLVIVFLVKFELINKEILNEAMGPNLWNFLGIIGISLFSINIVYYHEKLIIISKEVLLSTFVLGSLGFGLILGDFFFLNYKDYSWWIIGLFGIVSVFLLFILFLYNFIIGYFYCLLDKRLTFLFTLRQVNISYRWCVTVIILLIIASSFSIYK